MPTASKDTKANDDQQYDVIFIGSGMGSMACASILAQLRGMRVLMLERHFKMGGFTHVFKREGKYHWDVGVHYIGDLHEGSMLRHLFDMITRKRVSWNKMPSPFEKFVYPDFTFDVRDSEAQYRADLKSRFPDSAAAIDHYFEDIKSTASWFGKHVTMKSLPPAIDKIAGLLRLKGDGHAVMTTGEYMRQNIADEKLRAVLLSQWGDYGLPPATSSFVIHALIVSHYFGGGYYPVGGSGKIAEAIKPIIEEQGGRVLLDHRVDEVIIENNTVKGVRVTEVKGRRETEKEFYAPVVVSNVGAYNTYQKLVPASVEIPFRSDLRQYERGTTNVTLYLGLKNDPRSLGFQGENYWIFDDYDHDRIFERRAELLEGKIGCLYLSFPSLKDPEASAHTAEAITFCDYEPFAQWKDQPWLKRDEEYGRLKERITAGILNRLETLFPGFGDLVDYAELSTPLTNEHFTGHAGGNIYGIPCTPDRFQKDWIGVRTPVKNLYLTGADASSPGVAGAMMGGFATATVLLGMGGLMRLFKEMRSA
ncbi:MAG: NAD(P)/FAD-dependent oxidoreductase [Leptospiraceae bacterium]|nr:NAD(P)/FAD-dependent oxidoreductase [Leptospiraceae bacterium]